MKVESETTLIACSLEQEDVAERRARWQALASRAAAEVRSTGRGLRLSFGTDAGVEAELDRLVALERGCCAWADWSIRSDGERVELEVSGDSEEAVAAIGGMLGGLVPAVPRASVPVEPDRKAGGRGRALALAGALGLACLACRVPVLIAVAAGGSAAGALGGGEGVFVGVALSLAVFAAATHLLRRRKKATATHASSGCGC